jgi:hypothetical protein
MVKTKQTANDNSTEEPKKRKAPVSAQPRISTRAFIVKKDTKGAVQFQELDENMKPTEDWNDGNTAAGSIYLRKAYIEKEGFDPSNLTGCVITITLKARK